MPWTDSIENRLKLRSITDESTGCFLWQGKIHKNGYGAFTLANKDTTVHRASASIYLGLDINSNVLVLHKLNCPNKNCWNPQHLYLGNNSQNNYDTVASGKHRGANKTHCPRGHLYDSSSHGQRYCLECKREANKRAYKNRKANTI
jgi:hypothetical protein